MKQVSKNKLDENDNIVRYKTRLVVQGSNEEEGIEFEENVCSLGSS